MQHVQSAAFWQPVVLQSSCPIMPVLTEHGLEIAQLVLRGVEETAAGAVAMCTEM